MIAADGRPGSVAMRWLAVLLVWVVVAAAPLLVPGALETRTASGLWIILFVFSLFVVPALSIVSGMLGIAAQSTPVRREVVLGRVAMVGAGVVLVGAIGAFGAAFSLL